MVKSWTGLVLGILIDKGLIPSEEALACDFIPEWEDGCKHQVTLKNLLTMSAGLNKRRGAQGILAVEDMANRRMPASNRQTTASAASLLRV